MIHKNKKPPFKGGIYLKIQVNRKLTFALRLRFARLPSKN